MQYCRLSPTIDGANAHQHIFRRCFGVFNEHVEIVVIIENTCIQQFKFGVPPATPGILLHQLLIGKCCMRIFVEHTHVAVGRCTIEVEVEFFDIFTMVALWSGQAKQSLLENRVMTIPERESKAHAPLVIADPPQTILVPTISPRSSHIM